jgi:VanZ family protein
MDKIKNNNVVITLCMILYMLWIFVLSHIPSSDLETGFEFNDKTAHIILYMGLGFLMLRFFRIVLINEIFKASLLTLIFGTLFAVTDEIHQGFVGYFDTGVFGGARNPEAADVAADFAGLLIICIIYFGFNRFIISKNKTNTQE